MENPIIPPPTVCDHPRKYWTAQGSGGWGYGRDEDGNWYTESRHRTFGWHCICGAWIPNWEAEEEVYRFPADPPPILRYG